jgi:hypothetical protein
LIFPQLFFLSLSIICLFMSDLDVLKRNQESSGRLDVCMYNFSFTVCK